MLFLSFYTVQSTPQLLLPEDTVSICWKDWLTEHILTVETTQLGPPALVL